jgi:hypothetical protein
MTHLHKNPVIYEINTWAWLNELEQLYGKRVTLGSVPDTLWDGFAEMGIDALWFMGVWERSPAGIRIAMWNDALVAELKQVLPDFSEEDVVGSPYCVRRYVVDEQLGGPEGLAQARKRLTARGIAMILDFVPNHVAPDHPWVAAHPEYLIQGNTDDLKRDPASFIASGNNIIACGRDPNFPPWPDVLQLNAFNPGLRHAVVQTVMGIAEQCDGVRCDMAMLVMNDIFARTWGNRAGTRPSTEYWLEVIQAVRSDHPHFLFMAEAYWDLEWALQQQGFDFCYDKRLYDRLVLGNADSVRLHMSAERTCQDRLVRFIENHDEPRAAVAFLPERGRAAALIAATVPGARLFHEGQFEGRKVRLPVFLGRRPEEPTDEDIHGFYRRLLKIIHLPCLQDGQWQFCEGRGWPDNRSHENLLAWFWKADDDSCLIVVNFSDRDAQGMIRLPVQELRGGSWQAKDLFTAEPYERNGQEIAEKGLFVNLPRWGCHAFYCGRSAADYFNSFY